MLRPSSGKVLVTPYLPSQARADEVHARSGLFIPKPTNSGGSFEGIPSQGYVYALPEGYDGPLVAGMRVVFSEKAPKGFKNPEDPEQTLFALDLDQIVASIEEGAE